jgi:hypothetical protein
MLSYFLYDLFWWKYELNGLWTVTFCVIFQFLTMFNAIVGAGAVSRYGFGSGSDQKMRLRLCNTAYQNDQLLKSCILLSSDFIMLRKRLAN